MMSDVLCGSLGTKYHKHCRGIALWRARARRADAWGSVLGASQYVGRAIKFCIRDMQTVPVTEGLVVGDIPQTETEKDFARGDLEKKVEQ